jgi:anti-sigma regulatory factor (Ser/Thr protein kinase)
MQAKALLGACPTHPSVFHTWAEDYQRAVEGSVRQFGLAAEFDAGLDAPGRARRMVVAALGRVGYGDKLVQDAALVLTELAANAVRHAGSSFAVSVSVSVSSEGSILRIAVCDRGPSVGVLTRPRLIPRPGRGLGLIDAISTGWGTTAVSDGMVVWAELCE